MGKWYWVIVVVVLVTGVTASLYFGLEAKSVPLIRWSYFANATEASDAVQTRMSQELSNYQIYFLGPHPEKQLQIQTTINLVQWLKSQNPKAILVADRIMTGRSLEIQSLKPELILDLGKERERFLEGINAISAEQKVIVIAPNIYVTHFLAQSPVSEMQEQLQTQNYVVLSFMNFPRSREEEKDFEFPCRTSDSSATQLDLGCFVMGQSRPFYWKKNIEGKVPGFLNLVKSREYMFFLGQ
jgi:hypothetical protein